MALKNSSANYFRKFKRLQLTFQVVIGTSAIGRTTSSQRGMEGFQMIGMNLFSSYRLCSVWMFWIRGLILGAFAAALMPL